MSGQSRSAKGQHSFSLEYWEKLFNALPDPIFVKDQQHRWVFGNDAFSKILGKPLHEYLYKSDFDLFPKEIAEVFWKKDDEIFDKGVPNENEEKLVLPNGEERTVLTKKTPIDTKSGRMLVGIIRDITYEKENHRRLLYSSKMATYGEIASSLAHDLNNPLTIIKGRSQGLKRLSTSCGEKSTDVMKVADSIERACDRALDVMTELRKLAVGSGDISGVVKVKEAFNSILALMRPRFESTNIKFSVSIANDNLLIGCPTNEFRQLIIALTQFSFNSVYYETVKDISWRVESDGANVSMRLSDSSRKRFSSTSNTSQLFSANAKSSQFSVGITLAESIVVSYGGTLQFGTDEDNWTIEVGFPEAKSNGGRAA